MATKASAIAIVIISTFFTAIAQLMYKLSVNNISLNFYSIITNYFLIIGIILYIIATIMFIVALKHGELSVLFPLYAASYIWVTVLAFYFLNEQMNMPKLIGITSIIFGMISISRNKK